MTMPNAGGGPESRYRADESLAAGPPLVLCAAEVAAALDREALIEALAAAFRGGCEAPRRHHHAIPIPGEPDATLLLMPAWSVGRHFGVKVAAVVPGNNARFLPAVQSQYLLFCGRTGRLRAALDGNELTSRRTVAASSLAARFLALPGAGRLLIVGTGEIARHVAASHAALRPIRSVEVWGRSPAKAQAVAADLTRAGVNASPATDLAEACARADIITCCTLSREPLVEGRWLRPGTHLDLIGGFTPAMREVDDGAVARATLFIDTPAALHEAGDLAIPLARGIIAPTAVAGDLADLASGRHPGRTSVDEITLFKSVGASIEDLAAAILCVERHRARPASVFPTPVEARP
nr:ornithine cyclodeaminase family protein [Methylobacterium nodulans]